MRETEKGREKRERGRKGGRGERDLILCHSPAGSASAVAFPAVMSLCQR